jgi:predicted metal-binding membrane protein
MTNTRSSRTSISPATVSSAPDLTSRLLRRERLIVATGVALLALVSWWFVAAGAGMEGAMAEGPPPFGAVVLMWWLMMMAMMLPSAAPAILLYAKVRQARNDGSAIAHTWLFLCGYVVVWLLFSVGAAVAQQLLTGVSMALHDRHAEAALLIAAGAYQLSPLKAACVHECRSPAQFISRHWRSGPAGAVRLGVLHGASCVGCCWMLMALLFVGGVMNLLWIVALSGVVAVERLAPRGALLGQAAGVAMTVWALARLLGY